MRFVVFVTFTHTDVVLHCNGTPVDLSRVDTNGKGLKCVLGSLTL